MISRMKRNHLYLIAGSLVFLSLITVSGCKSKPTPTAVVPDYTRPLPPGDIALREVHDRTLYRNLLSKCSDSNDATLREALHLSIEWLDKPSARSHFPLAGISFDRARSSVHELADILDEQLGLESFINAVMDRFTLYESVGWNGRGVVLFTGYCAPEFSASLEPTGSYQYPLYRRPDDLATDPKTGEPLGRQLANGSIVPYPTRREIEGSNMLSGTELVWLSDPLDAYIIHVNGSAKLNLTDGSTMYVGYAGKTDQPYTGLGQTMLDQKLIAPADLSLPGLRRYFKAHPDQTQPMIYINDSYVFFQTYSRESWPSGSLGVRVISNRSLATDKAIFPRGGVVIVDTRIPTFSGSTQPFVQMMLDQDTGGAIKAPGRADIFMGTGKAAELLAGRQYQEGHLYYLFIRE